jgi:hypothetical protein
MKETESGCLMAESMSSDARCLKLTMFFLSPQRRLHLVVVVSLVQLCDSESNAGSSLTTNRATHASKFKG